MAEDSADLKKLYYKFKNSVMKSRKRFELDELEEFLIDKSGGVRNFEKSGGYHNLYRLLKDEESAGYLSPVKSSPYNSRRPALKTRWQLNKENKQGWDKKLIFKLSGRLDINYFLKRPALQTEKMAEKLTRLNEFLGEKDKREWASREERSLELFADEKFLSFSQGKKLLNRLRLSLADLKAEKYSQMFVYWVNNELIETATVERILILENHSAFITCKRGLEKGYSIFGFSPDILIYGAGKQIIDSFQFLEEIADSFKGQKKLVVKYAGDIDPEGWAIYCRLKEKYSEVEIKLHKRYYQQMLLQEKALRGGCAYPLKNKQYKNKSILSKVLAEFEANLTANNINLRKKVQRLWENDLRIPQEIITFEVLNAYKN